MTDDAHTLSLAVAARKDGFEVAPDAPLWLYSGSAAFPGPGVNVISGTSDAIIVGGTTALDRPLSTRQASDSKRRPDSFALYITRIRHPDSTENSRCDRGPCP